MIRLTTTLLLLFGVAYTPGFSQEHKEKITKTFTFDDSGGQNLLMIKNIEGSILIEGYQADRISVDVDKVITAESPEDLQEGIRDISLGVVHTGDSIILFTDSPYATLKRKNGKISYQWDWDSDDVKYRFKFDYAVKVPYGTPVHVSTVNEGDVHITDTRGTVTAHNVNGSVFLEKTYAVANASTVNGVVECEILKKPVEDCLFHTINGDMKITFPSNLSADISYDAMHGDFYTDFDVEILPASVKRTEESSNKGTTYKIEKNPKFRIGDGDVNMRFTTINGDMILKKDK